MQPTSRFENAEAYASYLATRAGRLRVELAWTALERFLPRDGRPHRALDVGGGTGLIASRLAAEDFDVVLLDGGEEMLAIARRHAAANGVAQRISFTLADVADLGHLFAPGSFDVVTCHHVLEFVADAAGTLAILCRVIAPGGLLSLVVRNRAGEALKVAVSTGDRTRVEEALSAATLVDSLFGATVRLFTPAELCGMAAAAGLEVVDRRGVRVFSDYLGRDCATDADLRALIDLEFALGERPEFAAVARYTQIIARRSTDREAKGRRS